MKLRLTLSLCLLGMCLASSSQALSWMGNTSLYQSGQVFAKRGGYVEPWQAITITTQTYPIEAGQRVVAVVETAGWGTAQEYEFTFDGNVGNNSRWYLTLGPWAQGTQVQFYLKSTKTGQATPFYDNNNSQNFGYHQRFASPYKEGAILQWFNTDYKDIMARLPEVVDAGYSALYLPPPSKSGGGGFSTGYNPVDRFDVGDRFQKGSVRTRYGTAQELMELIRVAKRMGLEVYADMVVNHNDNRASHSINTYPDMIPEDFHIKSSADTSNTEINFNVESPFSFGMLNYDLVGLADIALEDGNNVATNLILPPYATFNTWGKPSFIRQPTTPQLYPNNTPVAEDSREYLERWSKFMMDTVGFNGFRVDAVKHVPPGYFGWAPDQAASQGFANGNLVSELFRSNPGMTIFSEAYSSVTYELREYGKTGLNLLDFPLVFKLKDVFNSNGLGNLGATLGNGYSVDSATGLAFQQGGLAPDTSVSFVQSHDDGPPASNNMAYAFILARPGRPKVYYDGNNIQPGAWTNFPRPGRFDALGNGGDKLTKLVKAHDMLGRGYSVIRNSALNTLVFERQVNGRGLMLAGFNNRGDNTSLSVTVTTGFLAGTVLTDYTGQKPPVTVGANGVVTISIPPNYSAAEANNGTGYVYYAIAAPVPAATPVEIYTEGVRANARGGSVLAPFQSIITPIGTYGTQKSYNAATVSGNKITLFANFAGNPTGCLVRLNQGVASPGQTLLTNTPESIVDNFIPMESTDAPGQFAIRDLDISGLSEGLNLLKIRAFSDTQGGPGVFTDVNAFVFVKRDLPTGWKVDGDLTDFGTPLASQVRSSISNNNRVDGLYATNDDEYLYLGLAGRVDGSEGLLNGISLAIDSDSNGATGVRDLSTLNDDISPTTRLISNTKITLPTGFGADYFLSSFRNSSLTSAPEASFPGLLTMTPKIGAMAGFFRVNPTKLSVLDRLQTVISTQVRINKTDPAKGIESAVKLRDIFPSGIPASGQIKLLGWLGTTGESGNFLVSTDPLRATLGGRPAPNGYVTNQFIPTQISVGNDPGSNPVTVSVSQTYNLLMMQSVLPANCSVTPGPITGTSTTGYTQIVTIKNLSTSTLAGPFALKIGGLASGVSVLDKTGDTMIAPILPYVRVNSKGIGSGQSLRITVKYNSSTPAFTPSYSLFSGKGIL